MDSSTNWVLDTSIDCNLNLNLCNNSEMITTTRWISMEEYGQKVTRDNPSPRAYYKCANAPNCPVKKKVQRSVDDSSILVATYEGRTQSSSPNSRDHLDNYVVLSSNHSTIIDNKNNNNNDNNNNNNNNIMINSPTSSPSTISLDLLNHHSSEKTNDVVDTKALQRLLIEQMASSLTKDPSFTSALAAAISGKLSENTYGEKMVII
ncbi:putative WRKY transcription factor 40 [Bienertia sinuspersici]